MRQDLLKEKCERLSDLQNLERSYRLHEKPAITNCNDEGLSGKGIAFNPLPGFHFGICDLTQLRSPLHTDFWVDEPTLMVILVLKGSSVHTFKTKKFPAHALQESMYLIGYCDNISLEMFFPEQGNYSHIAFFVQESALRAYLGESSHHLIRSRIDAAAECSASGAAITGIAVPELLVQAWQFLDWQEDKDILQLRCAALNCFAKFFANPATLNSASSPVISEQDKNRIIKLKRYIEKDFLTIDSAVSICALCDMSFSKANRLFKELYSTTIANYVRDCKMRHAYSLLADRKCNVSECAFEVGYSNISHFIHVFKKCYNITPKTAHRLGSEKHAMS